MGLPLCRPKKCFENTFGDKDFLQEIDWGFTSRDSPNPGREGVGGRSLKGSTEPQHTGPNVGKGDTD